MLFPLVTAQWNPLSLEGGEWATGKEGAIRVDSAGKRKRYFSVAGRGEIGAWIVAETTKQGHAQRDGYAQREG